jgi:RNA recognition motif. (a.k.a. RRM, RBD, or RNP domain)
MTSTIYLSGLPSFWSDTNLRQTLAQFGTVVSATIVKDLFGHSLGLGVVQLSRGTGPAVEIPQG